MQIICFDWVNIEQIHIFQCAIQYIHIISFKYIMWKLGSAQDSRIFNHKIAMRKFNVKRWNGFYAFCVDTSLILSCHAWCNLKLLKLNYLISLTQQTYRIAQMVWESFHSEIYHQHQRQKNQKLNRIAQSVAAMDEKTGHRRTTNNNNLKALNYATLSGMHVRWHTAEENTHM